MKKLALIVAAGVALLSAEVMAGGANTATLAATWATCANGNGTCVRVKGPIRFILDANNYAEANVAQNTDIGCTSVQFQALGAETLGNPYVGDDSIKHCEIPQ